MSDATPQPHFQAASYTPIDNEHRTGETIELDGRWFRGCRYRECVLVYRGDQDFRCEDTRFEHCTLEAEGTARRVLADLAAVFDFAPLVGLLERAREQADSRPGAAAAREANRPGRLDQWGNRLP